MTHTRVRQVAPMFDAPSELKGYVGEEDGFDPLRLSTLFDMVCCRRQLPGLQGCCCLRSGRAVHMLAGVPAAP